MFAGADLDMVYTSDQLDEGKAPPVGTVFFDRGKWYKFVKYAEGTATLDLAVGDFVYYVDDSGHGSSTVTADSSDASGKQIGAGASMAVVDTDATYFWIQFKGNAILNTAIGGSPSDGDPLTCEAANDKALTLAAEADSTADYVSVCAIAVDVDAKEVALDCVW